MPPAAVTLMIMAVHMGMTVRLVMVVIMLVVCVVGSVLVDILDASAMAVGALAELPDMRMAVTGSVLRTQYHVDNEASTATSVPAVTTRPA